MDEPFGSLDAPRRRSFQDLLLQLEAETGHTRIVVTHDVEEAVVLGRRILVLGNDGSARGVVENPGAARASFRNGPEFRSVTSTVASLLEAK
jgi:NitT/TauT family transport system ATP-binding protein